MNKNDLRYLKTESNLKEAYLQILVEQDCRTITVRQLCHVAMCARNTFYQHYPDLEALKNGIITDVLNQMTAAFRTPKQLEGALDPRHNRQYVHNIVASVTHQQTTLRRLFGKDDGSFQKQLADVIYTQVMIGDRKLSQVADTAINRLHTAYLSSAIAGFIAKWMTDPTISAEVAETTLLNIHQATINTSSTYLASERI